VLLLAAAVVAVVGARPYAGGWNDGSRLATAESLVDRGTLAIDGSVFVVVPPADEGRPSPYPAHPSLLRENGTLDKLLIDGHFYSDKPPVQAVMMAGVYAAWRACGGPTTADRPDLFCWLLTVTSSGLAYVVAVWCVYRLGREVGLRGRAHALVTLAFAACTVAPAYSRHVNAHGAQLAAAAALCLALAGLGQGRTRRAAVAGFLAGFGYTLDLGMGPGLLLATIGYAAVVSGRWAAFVAGLAALPWLAAHHALNYAIGGTLVPANTVPAYLAWPGSPFGLNEMTGGWKHSAGGFLLYAADLMMGKKGFLLYNLPLWLVPGGAAFLWFCRRAHRPAVGFALGWTLLGWFAYAAASNNLSGQCLSVRWFVPLLAPGFWVLALVIREYPEYLPDLSWLSTVGGGFGVVMWIDGPWARHLPPGLWGWFAVAGIGWGVVRYRAVKQARRATAPETIALPEPTRRAA
jgi:hypothetical protein